MIGPELKNIGWLAAFLTSTTFIPQIIKGFRTRKLNDLSLLMLLTTFSGISLWLIYGLVVKDTIIIVANIVTLTSVSTLIIMKYYYSKKYKE